MPSWALPRPLLDRPGCDLSFSGLKTALLRARAIENLAYVVAPAQWGLHHAGRRSYGHTSVIDPWGKVVAELESGTGVVLARIDLTRVARLRRELPVLTHVRRELLGGPRGSG